MRRLRNLFKRISYFREIAQEGDKCILVRNKMSIRAEIDVRLNNIIFLKTNSDEALIRAHITEIYPYE